MKSSLFVVTLVLAAAAANAAHVDMKDPRRALGREDDVRIDAQLYQDTLTANGPITVAYQVENLSDAPIAIADRVMDVDFNPDEAMVTLSIGTEALTAKALPHLVVIAPGEKKTFKAGGTVHGVLNGHGPFAVVPHAVQIRVSVSIALNALPVKWSAAPSREAVPSADESGPALPGHASSTPMW